MNRGDLIATRDAYGRALAGLGGERQDVVVLDADLSSTTRTAMFAASYPERFFNVGVAEQNLLGIAAGLAASGKTVFCSTFAVFASGRAFDQLRNTIAYPGLNVKVCASHAGLTVGEDGASHQSVEDIALMRAVPNLTVLVPADAVETAQMVRAAAAAPGPVYIRLGRAPVPVIHGPDYRWAPGKLSTLRSGKDVTIAACGVMVARALQAADLLAGEGLEATVLNVSSLKPLDTGALAAAAGATGCVVTVEEHSVLGGLGGAVCEALAEAKPVPVVRVGIQDRFGQSGQAAELLEAYGLGVSDIVAACRLAKARAT